MFRVKFKNLRFEKIYDLTEAMQLSHVSYIEW